MNSRASRPTNPGLRPFGTGLVNLYQQCSHLSMGFRLCTLNSSIPAHTTPAGVASSVNCEFPRSLAAFPYTASHNNSNFIINADRMPTLVESCRRLRRAVDVESAMFCYVYTLPQPLTAGILESARRLHIRTWHAPRYDGSIVSGANYVLGCPTFTREIEVRKSGRGGGMEDAADLKSAP